MNIVSEIILLSFETRCVRSIFYQQMQISQFFLKNYKDPSRRDERIIVTFDGFHYMCFSTIYLI